MKGRYYLDYLWTDEDGYPLEEMKREYFPDADALSKRRAELVETYALIVGAHSPKAPAIDAPLII